MSVKARSQTKARHKFSPSQRVQIIAAVISAAGVVSAAIVALAGNDGPTSSLSAPNTTATTAGPQPPVRVPPSPAGRLTLPLPVGLRVDTGLSLDSRNFCSWRLGTNPIPLAGINPLTVRIDEKSGLRGDENPGRHRDKDRMRHFWTEHRRRDW